MIENGQKWLRIQTFKSMKRTVKILISRYGVVSCSFQPAKTVFNLYLESHICEHHIQVFK